MTATTPPPPSDPPPAASYSTATTEPTKVIGRRIGAWFIDALIGGLVVMIAVLATFTNTQFDNEITAELQCDLITDLTDDMCIQSGTTLYVGTSGDVGVVMLVWVVIAVVLTMIVPAFAGWSPGKLLLGLRVVDRETFEHAGAGPNLLRGVLWIVDGFFYVSGPLVGGIAMVSSDGNRRVGDMVAKTIVVKAEQVGTPVAVRNVNSLAGPKQTPVFVPSGQPRPPYVANQNAPTYTPPPPTGPPASAPAAASPPPPSAPPTTPPVSPAPPTTPPVSSPPPTATPPVFPPPTSEEPAQPSGDDPPPPTGPLAEDQPPAPVDVSPPEAAEAPPTTTADDAEAAPEEPPVQSPPPSGADTPPPPLPEAPAAPVTPPNPAPRPGVDAPMWDDARDTYIQWDPELQAWMMWSEAGGRWVPISR